jgi:DNA-binding response OmpR family regulator
MTPSIDSILRAKLHRIIDEVFAATAEGAEVGADTPAEQARAQILVARLRDLEPSLAEAAQETSIKVGDLIIDLAGHEVFSAGRRIRLTHREFTLLRFLAIHRGRACTREELVVHVWTERELTSARTVDIHIHRLRQKLGRPFSELLETLRNVGYKLRTAPYPKETRLRRTYQDQPLNLVVSLGQSP